MKDKEQLNEFYQAELLPVLQGLENDRLKIVANLRNSAIVMITLLVIIAMFASSKGAAGIAVFPAVFIYYYLDIFTKSPDSFLSRGL